MIVTELGMVIEARDVQEEKVLRLMVSNEVGRVMEVR